MTDAQTEDRWRRIPIIALILVMLYFVIEGQVQSAENGASIQHLTDSQSKLLKTVQRDEGYVLLASQYIQAQQRVIKRQNELLRKHGLKVIPLPKPPSPPPVSKAAHRVVNGGDAPSLRPSNSPGHSPSPSNKPTPQPTPSHSPTPRPPGKICPSLPVVGKHCLPLITLIGVF